MPARDGSNTESDGKQGERTGFRYLTRGHTHDVVHEKPFALGPELLVEALEADTGERLPVVHREAEETILGREKVLSSTSPVPNSRSCRRSLVRALKNSAPHADSGASGTRLTVVAPKSVNMDAPVVPPPSPKLNGDTSIRLRNSVEPTCASENGPASTVAVWNCWSASKELKSTVQLALPTTASQLANDV